MSIKKILKYEYECNYCHEKETFYNQWQGNNHLETARIKGWAISRDRYECYCPNCAIHYRNTGKPNMIITAERKGLRKDI